MSDLQANTPIRPISTSGVLMLYGLTICCAYAVGSEEDGTNESGTTSVSVSVATAVTQSTINSSRVLKFVTTSILVYCTVGEEGDL